MFVKLRLINVCIRHKCSHVKHDHFNKNDTFNKSLVKYKKLRLLKNDKTVLTSNNNALDKKRINIKNTTVSEHEDKGEFVSSVKHDLYFSIKNSKKYKILSFKKSNDIIPLESKVKKEFNETMEETKTLKSSENSGTDNNELRINEINIQMLPKSLYEQLFPNCNNKSHYSSETIKSIEQNLKEYNIDVEKASRLPNISINLPKLEGKNIEEHFYKIAQVQTKPYVKLLNEIINKIPKMPEKWLLQEGWTKYTDNSVEKVDYPLEDALIFDVETCVKYGPVPILATAVSTKAWYGWVSKSLLEECKDTFKGQIFKTDVLIPMESIKNDGKKLTDFQKKSKIIVGHNVSFDRSKIKEQYWLNTTGTRFIDTMSMHICISGVSSFQRASLKSKKKSSEKDENWQSKSSLNNLVDVHKLYCGHTGKTISKLPRDVFIEGNLADIKERFNELMSYCASDVIATHEILCNMLPIFYERFPHPVTLAGMLELGMAYLPINSNWQRYIDEAESTFEDLNYEAKVSLSKRANVVCKLMHNEKYKNDLWMWDQDWSTQELKMKLKKSNRKEKETIKENEKSDCAKYLTNKEDEVDPLQEKFAYLEDTKYLLYAYQQHMPGYPAWYRKLCPKLDSDDWAPGPQNISTSMQVVPKLLNLTWENYPLHYIKEHGWGILVPYNDDPNCITKLPLKEFLIQCPLPKVQDNKANTDYAMSKLTQDVEKDFMKQEFWRLKDKKEDFIHDIYKGSAVWCNIDIDKCFYFFKLPHKDGPNFNVGNPLARDFLNKFSENGLAASDATAQNVLKIARMLSYWRNNKNRIMSQLAIWLDNEYLPNTIKNNKKYLRYGAIIPIVVASGTLTRRAVEPTWMTASNAHSERVGSELRAMIQAPPGYNIVGADVDSQELWISSIIGDAHYQKIHGATPFGWMTLDGTKSNGTDMHSVTAKAVGISRDHAKVINYARIYGAGQKFAERLLKQFNPSMTTAEARLKSKKMFSLTKGNKVYVLKPEYINDHLIDKAYTLSEAFKISKMYGKPIVEIFNKGEWMGGSESAMFNRLEQIAESVNPVTPFLNSRLSRALEDNIDDSHLPTKINWVVQSGAVDFLHLMLVSMRWLMRDNARFCLSFHDEIRYLVPSRYKYNAALAMHVTNLMVRAFCASRLDMKDLPMSVAFFSNVDIDTVLRKESNDDCKTPSNPHGLEAGYGISCGESLNVWQVIEKSYGSLGWWNEKFQKRK